jgi:REP element-mobilizing transposase RayT
MAAEPRIFLHHKTYEVCFRTEDGLPLICTPYMKAILLGIFAKAQTLYPVTICHAVVMANHIHSILVIQDPEAAHQFIGYVKRESAHAVNRLLGRKRKTVWEDGYDAILILDTKKALERIAYHYLNPSRADLERRIEKYPHLHTWRNFRSGVSSTITVKRIARDDISALPKRSLSRKEQEKLTAALLEAATEENELTITPDAWLPTMIDGVGQEPEMLRQEVIQTVSEEERRIEKQRRRTVIGAHALELQDIRRAHTPKKRGKKMRCLCSFKELRQGVIAWFKEYARSWQQLRTQLPWAERITKTPPGIFSPGGRLRSNLIPSTLPF